MNPQNGSNPYMMQQAQMQIAQSQQQIERLQQQASNWNNAAPLQTVSSQYPQAQQVPTPKYPSLYGRIINSTEEIRPNEIAMDGSISIFLASNLQEIYAKAWNANTGLIDTVRYVLDKPAPKESEDSTTSSNDFKNEIVSRLEKIEEKIEKIASQRPQVNGYYNHKPKKGEPNKKEAEVKNNAD